MTVDISVRLRAEPPNYFQGDVVDVSADWNQIKTEYITTDTSYRKLAEKYGIDQATISRRAKKEDWVGQRQQHVSRMQAQILTSDAKSKVERVARLKTVADKLLNKIEQAVECDAPMQAAAIKNLSEALRNIQQAQMLRTEMDDLEQEARIAKLQKEARNEDEKKQITVVLEGKMKDYAQ